MQKSYPLSPCLSILVLESVLDSQFVNLFINLTSMLSFTTVLREWPPHR